MVEKLIENIALGKLKNVDAQNKEIIQKSIFKSSLHYLELLCDERKKIDFNSENINILSLGENCIGRTLPSRWLLIKNKDSGRLSYPFDLAVHYGNSMLQVLKDDFADYVNEEFLYFCEISKCWKHKKYLIVFNHDMDISSSDINKLISRYTERIKNFKKTLKEEGKKTYFIYSAFKSDFADFIELEEVLKNFTNNFHIIVLDHRNIQISDIKNENISIISSPFPSNNYIWHDFRHYLTKEGIEFERKCINDIVNIINENNKIELILHIGAGKTGTSSIQETLRNNSLALNDQHVKYLGLMLEFAEHKKYAWQHPSQIVVFHSLSEGETLAGITEIFSYEIKNAKINGINKLVWSNESFLGNMQKLIMPLKLLQSKENIKINFIVYVRDYCKWSISAYKQWGIKHKTYKGKIQKFSEFKGHKIPFFFKMIKPLYENFPEQITIRNMDSKENIVDDFLNICDINSSQINSIRFNDSPSNEELYLRGIYNNLFEEPMLPNEFDNSIGKHIEKSISIDEFSNEFFPQKKDLNEIVELTRDDINNINGLLMEQNETKLDTSFDENKIKKIDFNYNLLLEKLAQLTITQSIKINLLENEIKNLKNSK